ncbi:MAG: 2-C-methyl-D-erythritol 4-phosphate cytidylyltransferase [Bacteroidetes bacterium]|uniref:2-C-methyl-D-erythritol 4-phosphate cytidylyltransferase n=1 Tax=Candidatus Cryptobacteroides merdavium TaxID=2840769 RepID=A0A9D9ECU7_9BACT|nr:2-C-methyl-D-erythritol 4-phosphate cytidylyltransferase [Candidatus Cryptobacteroides merdavium]
MKRKKYLIVMAGGSGVRMGGPLPKQFLDLGGRSVLHVTIEKFAAAEPDIKVVTVLPEAHVPLWKEYCLRKNVVVPQTVVKGGISRFHSVRNGLAKVPDGALVAIHDGVRPLLSEDMINRMFSMAEDVPSLIPVIPSTDTIRALTRTVRPDGSVAFDPVPGPAPDRSVLFRVQTPQIFHSELIKKAYRQAYDLSFTDDASVAERDGMELAFTEGESLNIKITTPADLALARAVISMKNTVE